MSNAANENQIPLVDLVYALGLRPEDAVAALLNAIVTIVARDIDPATQAVLIESAPRELARALSAIAA